MWVYLSQHKILTEFSDLLPVVETNFPSLFITGSKNSLECGHTFSWKTRMNFTSVNKGLKKRKKEKEKRVLLKKKKEEIKDPCKDLFTVLCNNKTKQNKTKIPHYGLTCFYCLMGCNCSQQTLKGNNLFFFFTLPPLLTMMLHVIMQ